MDRSSGEFFLWGVAVRRVGKFMSVEDLLERFDVLVVSVYVRSRLFFIADKKF